MGEQELESGTCARLHRGELTPNAYKLRDGTRKPSFAPRSSALKKPRRGIARVGAKVRPRIGRRSENFIVAYLSIQLLQKGTYCTSSFTTEIIGYGMFKEVL